MNKAKDMIYRHAAIDALTEYGNGRTVYISVEEAFRRIEQLPSAQPERKRGKWIHRGCGIFSCSECDEKIGTNVYTEAETVRFRFCPHCGTDMRGEKSE